MQEQAEGEDEEVFNVSRFRPVLQNVLKDVIRNSLSEQEVPYLVAPDSHGGVPLFSNLPVQLLPFHGYCGLIRFALTGWQCLQNVITLIRLAFSTDGRGAASTASMTRRVFVFVIGGITYRQAHLTRVCPVHVDHLPCQYMR